MQETQEDLKNLHELIEKSIKTAGNFLHRSFQMPEHSLSAGQLVNYLQGNVVVSLATVTAKGEPRVAPIVAMFVHGCFHIPTIASAARAKHILKRPVVSLTHYVGLDLAIIIHGQATVIPADAPTFIQLDDLHRNFSGQSVLSWGEGIYLRINADVLYSFARYPDQYDEPMPESV